MFAGPERRLKGFKKPYIPVTVFVKKYYKFCRSKILGLDPDTFGYLDPDLVSPDPKHRFLPLP